MSPATIELVYTCLKGVFCVGTAAIIALVTALIVMYCARQIRVGKVRDKKLDEIIDLEDGSMIAPDELAEGIDVSPDFWISSEGVVHNSLCRWYEKCDGTTWDGESSHSDCGLCGGTRPIVRLWNLPEWKAAHSDKE